MLFPRVWDWVRAIRRIRRTYYAAHGFYPSLVFPARYTEKMQWRKLFDLNPAYSILCNKLAVRDFVKERVGQELLIPLLWFGDDPSAIPFDTLEPPYILKSSHASGHAIIVENKASLDETAIRETARNWLTWNHGKALDEPGYIHVPQALLIERLLLNRDGSPPIERKFIVFHGTVRVVQTVTVSSTDRARCLSHHHLDWTEIPFTEAYPRPTKSVNPPRHFEKMVEVAERMGAGLDHVRVDMYECNDEIYVGELTLYSNSGLQPFEPESADYLLGSYWDLPRNRMRAVWTMLTKRREIRRAFIQ